MERINEVLSLVAIATAVVVIVFILAKYNYLIKKTMVEKGLMIDKPKSRGKYIDVGCIVIGLGLGFLISSIFTEMNLTEDTTDLLVWGTLAVFGGASLIVAHFVRKRFDS